MKHPISKLQEKWRSASDRLELLRDKIHKYNEVTEFEWRTIFNDFKKLSEIKEFKHKSLTALGSISAMRLRIDEYRQYMNRAGACGDSYYYELNNVLSGSYVGEFERAIIFREKYLKYNGLDELVSAIISTAQVGLFCTADLLAKRMLGIYNVSGEEHALKRLNFNLSKIESIKVFANYLQENNVPEEVVCARIGDAARVIVKMTNYPVTLVAHNFTEVGIIYDFKVKAVDEDLIKLEWGISESACEKFDDKLFRFISVGVSPFDDEGSSK